MIYCATVPYHKLFVMRNGRACWCGNSGLFYDLFDPADKIGTDFFRVQFKWDINRESETYVAMVLAEKENLRRKGKEAFLSKNMKQSLQWSKVVSLMLKMLMITLTKQ